jgi:transposase-like protein
MTQKTRKHLPGKDKIRLLKLHFLGKKPISEVCESEKVLPASFYQWQRELFDRGAAVFDAGRRQKRQETAVEQKIAALEAKLIKKNEVIAELMQENINLKKLDGEI